MGNHSTSKNNEVLTNDQIRNRTCCRCSSDGSTCLAGPYVNVEVNAGWTGDDYTGATTDIHLVYEGEVGAASYYVQGVIIVATDGAENSTRFSGKAGFASLSLMLLASMVNFPSSLLKTSSWMILA